MQIRANAWHLRVFLQAHVHDRYWIDQGTINPAEECKTPETDAYEEFEKAFQLLPIKERDYKQRCDLAEAAQKSREVWVKQQAVLYTAQKSTQVSERLYSGRMSLCPYFWSIVSTLVFYYGFVRSTRPFRNFFNQVADGLATAVGALILAGVVVLIGYGIYTIHDQIPTPAEIVVGVKQSVKEYRQNRVQEQAAAVAEQQRAQQQAQMQLIWQQQHPEDFQRQRLHEAEESRRQSQRNRQDLKEFALGLGVFVFGISVVLGIFYLIGKGLEWLANRYGWGTVTESKPPSAFRLWLTMQMRKIWTYLEPLRRFFKDTKELVRAFAKARKEKVCPYLEIANGEDHSDMV